MFFFLYQPEWIKTVILIWFVFQGTWKIRGQAGWREEKVQRRKCGSHTVASAEHILTESHEQPHSKH